MSSSLVTTMEDRACCVIAEWAADASGQLLAHCGATLRRRVLRRVDGDALDAASAAGSPPVRTPPTPSARADTGPPAQCGRRSRWAANPTLHTLVKELPWKEAPLMDRTRTAAHGRDEIRRLTAVAVPSGGTMSGM
ncbi:hypothetical protein ABZ915_29185 [Streptomyces sp. NPDC046915]|uniref:hypothetical protein n=1 Tax=Streptomyces sp. NPDC046915 TaxID=3155257 RepID=UPI0033CFDB14